MASTMKGKTLVKGHTLVMEGRLSWCRYDSLSHHFGRGTCSCGAQSDELPTTTARQRWHRNHKEEMKRLELER